MGDRLVLEIIAERKIAEHFEERMVPRGVADIVEIVMFAPRPHALLTGRRFAIRAAFETGEHILEWHHARVHEHQGRIVLRHQWRGGDAGMPGTLEILEEGAADVVRGHEVCGHGQAI